MLFIGHTLRELRRSVHVLLRRASTRVSACDDAWRASRVADDGTHHVDVAGAPLYAARFAAVLPFHAPGLAPAQLSPAMSWCHVTPSGEPLSMQRYQRTFGFYEQRAAVNVGGVTVRAAAGAANGHPKGTLSRSG